jgi:DNA invertase Pin-like site-specific DNA recombinase
MYGCYLRVSDVGQNEAGQRREIEKWLRAQGITDYAWFIDRESGDNLDRPAFEQLLSHTFTGEVHAVVVWKLDRLSRSIVDGVNTLADWCERGAGRHSRPSTPRSRHRAFLGRSEGHCASEGALAGDRPRRFVALVLL